MKIMKLTLLLTSFNAFGQKFNRDSSYYESKRINILTSNIDKQHLKKTALNFSKDLDTIAGFTIQRIEKVSSKKISKYTLTSSSNSVTELYTHKDTLLKTFVLFDKNQTDNWMGIYFKNDNIIYLVGSPCDRSFPETSNDIKFVEIARYLTQNSYKKYKIRK